MPPIRTLRADAVLFDLDGVLVDSTGTVEQVWREFAARHDLDAQALLRDLHGRRMVDIIRRALPHLDATAVDAESVVVERMEVDAAGVTSPQPGALELVTSLHDVPWAIVTSGTRPVAFSRIDAVGLTRPTIIVTAEDVDEGKPSPAPYLAAAASLDVDPSRCVVIEDAPAGVTAARAAGATAVAVTTSHAPARLSHAHLVVRDTASVRRVAAAAGGLRLRCSALPVPAATASRADRSRG